MNNDFDIIKKKYGEKMARLCRKLFPTLLEKKGLLPQLLEKLFTENRMLYNDIMLYGLETSFKGYVYSFTDIDNWVSLDKKDQIISSKTPKQLLKEVGYKLYKCRTNYDIQHFRKYYNEKEELCTFDEKDRLKRCHVFFAVKENVKNIKREDFHEPRRQDEYGTSVLSIQFTKDEYCTLSIKNRYNHEVDEPDATFSNNLDNIVLGLTEAFERKYNLVQKNKDIENFRIPGYVKANDGKIYKYNSHIDNIYYCPNNIIIDNYEIKRFCKDKYIVFDYFILDMELNTIYVYDNVYVKDSLMEVIGNIQKIKIGKTFDNKKIIINSAEKNYPITIVLNNNNQIISYTDLNVREFPNNFIEHNTELCSLNTENVENIGDMVLAANMSLKELYLPKVKKIGRQFVCLNSTISHVNLSNVTEIGNASFQYNTSLETLELPNVEKIGISFLFNNIILTHFSAPKLKEMGESSLGENEMMKPLIEYLQKNPQDFIENNKTR